MRRDEDIGLIVANNVKALQKALKIKNGQLAERSGVSLRHISNIRSGEKSPTTDILEKIAPVLKVTIWQLLHPNTAADLAVFKNLETLRENYLSANQKGKKAIEAVAEHAGSVAK